MKVGIIGLGTVGAAQERMFGGHVHVTYDPLDHDTYPYEQLSECDFAVVCVGTPAGDDGRADLSQVEDAAGHLPPGLPVALRSTVPPGTTDRLFSNGVHVPEFMGESVLHSWQRSEDVPYMLIGGTPEATVLFEQVFRQVYPGRIHHCTAKEAELAKYAANLYWATRVTFVNEFANICERFGVDYERVREAWLKDPRMLEPYTRRAGFPAGFDGRCWPKDLSALIHASVEAGYCPTFLMDVREANDRYRRGSIPVVPNDFLQGAEPDPEDLPF